MSEVTVEEGLTWLTFRKDGFAVIIYPNSMRMTPFAEHPCKAQKEFDHDHIKDTLLPSEMQSQNCMFCGPLDFPGELLAIYYMYSQGEKDD